MIEPSAEIIGLLFAAALLAGFVDSIAGGGGLITVPALLLAGFPPVAALGINKLQGLFGAGSAALTYASRGLVDLRSQLPWFSLAAMGSALGALLATLLPGDLLKMVLPPVLIAIALYFLLKPNLGDDDRGRRMAPLLFGMTIVPLIGFYDGLLGPGTGSFFMLALVTLSGFGVLKATAHTKFLNFGSNIGGFAVFALAGVLDWKVGLVMGLGQIIGARIGAGLAIRKGARVIAPMLVLTCTAMAIRLILDPSNPLRQAVGF